MHPNQTRHHLAMFPLTARAPVIQSMLMALPAAESAHPSTEIDVSKLEDEICQLLADLLQLHHKVQNGIVTVKIQHAQFAFVQVTFDRKPQVKYMEALQPQTS